MSTIGGYLLGLVEAIWRDGELSTVGAVWGLLAVRLYRSL